MNIQFIFRANYQLEVPPELPNNARVLYFPPVESGKGNLYESLLKFDYPDQQPWYGVFAARSKRGGGLTTTTTLPDPDSCLISVLGTAYIVSVKNPNDWSLIDPYPLMQLQPVMEPELLVLGCFNKLFAYGKTGRRWESRNLCSDGLTILGVRNGKIECKGWDAPTGEEIYFAIDVDSGLCQKV